MPIHVPGKRSKRGLAYEAKNPVANLSLTPMVDMFTVLVVFLLQNFAVTGAPIEIYKDINLPPAAQTKALKPTNVVTINLDKVLFNSQEVMSYDELKENKSWFVLKLNKRVKEEIERLEKEKSASNVIVKNIKKALKDDDKKEEEEVAEHLRLTVQADKDVDFLSIKKAMYTSMEAGILEVNFAVLQKGEKK